MSKKLLMKAGTNSYCPHIVDFIAVLNIYLIYENIFALQHNKQITSVRNTETMRLQFFSEFSNDIRSAIHRVVYLKQMISFHRTKVPSFSCLYI